jgi:hypothetical protein
VDSLKKKADAIIKNLEQKNRICRSNLERLQTEVDSQKEACIAYFEALRAHLLTACHERVAEIELLSREENQKFKLWQQGLRSRLVQVQNLVRDIARSEKGLHVVDKDSFDQVTYNFYENLRTIDDEANGLAYPELRSVGLKNKQGTEATFKSLCDQLMKTRISDFKFDFVCQEQTDIDFAGKGKPFLEAVGPKDGFKKVSIVGDFWDTEKATVQQQTESNFSFCRKEDGSGQKVPLKKHLLDLEDAQPFKPVIRTSKSVTSPSEKAKLGETGGPLRAETPKNYQFFFKKFNLKTEAESLPRDTKYVLGPLLSDRIAQIQPFVPPLSAKHKDCGDYFPILSPKGNQKTMKLNEESQKKHTLSIPKRSSEPSDQRAETRTGRNCLSPAGNLITIDHSKDWTVMQTPEIKERQHQ